MSHLNGVQLYIKFIPILKCGDFSDEVTCTPLGMRK